MRDQIIQSPLLSALPGLSHGFLSDHTPGGRQSLDELLPHVATVKQVHGHLLVWTDRIEKREREADALATLRPGLSVGVYSADCTPVLVAAVGATGICAVMAVHAGWRGTAQEIAGLAFSQFAEEAVRAGAKKFVAAIGPCISLASFEVGKEVVDAFPQSLDRGLARFLRKENGQDKFLFDLPGENARQLRQAAAQKNLALELDVMQECTLQNGEKYPSYRRDGQKAGRILSYLSIEN